MTESDETSSEQVTMDFRLGEEQQATRKAAASVFGPSRPPLGVLEGLDAEAWRSLAACDLTGLGLAEDVGGAGCGALEVCALLVEQGRSLVAVPGVETVLVAGPAIDRYGCDEQRRRLLPAVVAGESVIVPVLGGTPGQVLAQACAGGWTLNGVAGGVPYGASADVFLVAGGVDDGTVGVFLVESAAPGVEIVEEQTSCGQPQAQLILDGVRCAENDLLTGADCHRFLLDRSVLGACAVQVGVLDEALRITARYTCEREQFGRPIATFQAVAMRAADAYADVATARVTMWRAAWLLATGQPVTAALAVAKYWAAECGYRVSTATQHLHGGMGVATDYPLHRYLLWARHNELAFGAANAQLAALGRHLADGGPDS